jgi:hypothetical protein
MYNRQFLQLAHYEIEATILSMPRNYTSFDFCADFERNHQQTRESFRLSNPAKTQREIPAQCRRHDMGKPGMVMPVKRVETPRVPKGTALHPTMPFGAQPYPESIYLELYSLRSAWRP